MIFRLPLELNGRTAPRDHAHALDLLDQVGLADRRDAFFSCWVQKEAFLKATGQGLHAPLQDIEVRFTPAPDFHGAASFSYTVSDGNGGTDTATVPVPLGTVLLVSDEPVSGDGDGVRLPGQSLLIHRPSG